MKKNTLLKYVSILLPLGLAACVTPNTAHYDGLVDHGYTIAPIKDSQIAVKYRRQAVDFQSPYKPGTIVVDLDQKFLYVTVSESTAIRYGISAPKNPELWYGRVTVHHKALWPKWMPTQSMLKANPSYLQFQNGMNPGIDNPLGARALYLYANNKDTLYRIHGTSEWWSIGKNNSEGCFRLLNEDIIDLYDRVPNGSKVIVLKPALAFDK